MYSEAIRELNAKKYEIIGELERVKACILSEMSSVDKHSLTRIREIISHYDRLEKTVTDKLNSLDIKTTTAIKSIEENRRELEDELAKLDKFSEDLKHLMKDVEDSNLSETLKLIGNIKTDVSKLAEDYSNIYEELAIKKIVDIGRFRKFLAMTGGLRNLFAENKKEHNKHYVTVDSFGTNYIVFKCGYGVNACIMRLFIQPNTANRFEISSINNKAILRKSVYSTVSTSKTLNFIMVDNNTFEDIENLKDKELKFNELVICYDVSSNESVVNVLLKITPNGVKIIEKFTDDLLSSKVTSLMESDNHEIYAFGNKIGYIALDGNSLIEETVEDIDNTVIKTFKFGGEL